MAHAGIVPDCSSRKDSAQSLPANCHVACVDLVSSIPSFWSIFTRKGVEFYQHFEDLHWDDHGIFVFCYVNVITLVYFFLSVESFLHSRNKSHLLVVYNSFNVLLHLVCWYSFEVFSICIHPRWKSVFFSWYLELSSLVVPSPWCCLCRRPCFWCVVVLFSFVSV